MEDFNDIINMLFVYDQDLLDCYLHCEAQTHPVLLLACIPVSQSQRE